MASHVQIECIDCNHRTPYHPLDIGCPNCGSPWRQARYDLAVSAPKLERAISQRAFDMWRYAELLPVQPLEPLYRMGEGGTPLIPAHNFGMMIGLPNVFIKDERHGPTTSFKDRQAALTVAALKEAGITEAVVASTGNVAIAYAAYCARTGIKLWAFLTSLVPADKMHEVAIYGTQVVKVTSTYDQAKRLAAEFANERKLYLDRGTRSIAAVESMKTIAFEIAEQLGELDSPRPPRGLGRSKWRAPDWYIQAVSGGIGPMGVLKGFTELAEAGWIETVPAIAGIQAAGCAPMTEAWRKNAASVTPIDSPLTHITTLSTGDPGRTYTLLSTWMRHSAGGIFESVTDEEAFRAIHIVAKMEGLSIEPAAAVAFAGLIKLAQSGHIKRDQLVVVNCSGHTMPIEKSLLGDGWFQDVELPTSAPEEGLLAALDRLDRRHIRDVLVVDDHAPARVLIRRILQAQGDFIIREVASGSQALEEAVRRRPDLIILDLMMPEMDGFAVLDRLKAQRTTADTPVIVVTAKELTAAEKKRLEGQISRLMVKGDFLTDELIDEISKVLGDKDTEA